MYNTIKFQKSFSLVGNNYSELRTFIEKAHVVKTYDNFSRAKEIAAFIEANNITRALQLTRQARAVEVGANSYIDAKTGKEVIFKDETPTFNQNLFIDKVEKLIAAFKSDKKPADLQFDIFTAFVESKVNAVLSKSELLEYLKQAKDNGISINEVSKDLLNERANNGVVTLSEL